MKKLVLILAGITLGAGGAFGGELADIVKEVTNRHPGLMAARDQVAAAEAGIKEAARRSLPMIRAGAQAVRGNDPVYVFGSLLQQRAFEPRFFDVGFLNHPGDATHIRSSVEAGVPVFTGFALTKGRRLAALGEEQSRFALEAAEQGVRLSTIEAYLEVLEKQAVEGVLNERILSAENEVASAERLRKKGLVLGSDYFAALAIQEGLKAWRENVAAQKEAAEAVLAGLRGKAQTGALRGRLPEETAPLSKGDPSGRADVRAARLESEAGRVAASLETAGRWPRVEAFASAASNTNDFSRNVSDRMWGVKVGLDFFDPTRGARGARAKVLAEAGTEMARSTEEEASSTAAQVRAAHAGALRALEPAKASLAHAREALKRFRPLYQEGRQSIMEVLRAEEGLARAEAAYLEVLKNAQVFRARRLWATGRLTETAVSEMEEGGRP